MEEIPMVKPKKILQTILPVLAAAFLLSLILNWLYHKDNKYTHKGTQAISGVLILDNGTLEEEKLFYLTRGWNFFPGKLLSPEDFVDGNVPDAYMQTVTVGRQSNFDLSDKRRPTGGSASYSMTLILPEEERAYTLVLPEIYSAYRLYVDGKELLTMGVPESDGFTDKLARRSVTFVAGGQTELLLAVSNRSHFSDGMTYPPVFGIPEAVREIENIRLFLGLLMLVFAVLSTGLSLYMIVAFKGGSERKMLLFFFASLCITVTYMYPAVFQFAGISPKFWYAAELFGIYGTYLFVVMLQNEISDAGLLPERISTAVLAVFTALSVLYSLLPGYFVWQVRLFGKAATAVKLFTVGYLFYCAVRTSMRDEQNSRLLLFCTTAFGLSVLYDRVHPGWEPILGGWPTEYGCLVLIVGLGMILWQEFSEGYRLKLIFAEEKRRLTRQVAMQKAHYLELSDKIEDTIRMRHDERHHLQTLYSIYEAKDYDRLGAYLSDYVLTSMPRMHTVLCKNLIVDSVLRYYEGLCLQEEIRFECSVGLPPELPVPEVELSILFGNLLENAYEAARKEGCADPFVSCQARIRNGTFYLLIKNSFVTPVRRKGGRFLSVRHEGYGVGTESARTVAENYGGSCVFEEKEGIFVVSVMFLLQENMIPGKMPEEQL